MSYNFVLTNDCRKIKFGLVYFLIAFQLSSYKNIETPENSYVGPVPIILSHNYTEHYTRTEFCNRYSIRTLNYLSLFQYNSWRKTEIGNK